MRLIVIGRESSIQWLIILMGLVSLPSGRYLSDLLMGLCRVGFLTLGKINGDDFEEATAAAVSPISELGRIDPEESDMIQSSIKVSSEGMVLYSEFDSTSSIVVSIVRDFGFARESNSMEGGVELSALGLGVADKLLDWSPLMAIAPSSNSLELACQWSWTRIARYNI